MVLVKEVSFLAKHKLKTGIQVLVEGSGVASYSLNCVC